MKRPFLVHFTAIINSNHLAIKASISKKERYLKNKEINLIDASSSLNLARPYQSLGLIFNYSFRIKIILRDQKNHIIYQKEIDTDRYGTIFYKIPKVDITKEISKIYVYEVSMVNGIDLLMGSFLPLKINNPNKVIITDFDKTLVDTKYSTLKEVYLSLNNPIDFFPSVDESIELLKKFINNSFECFILSASPHFYDKSIRDWLYQNEIFTTNIFLKDYRKIFSFSDMTLETKDLKKQGFYKLYQIVQILNMTEIPDELVLFGDSFESDIHIYLAVYALLMDQMDPWTLWDKLKTDPRFKFNTKQNTQFLTLFYQLGSLLTNKRPKSVEIYIRCTKENYEMKKTENLDFSFLEKNRNKVSYYIGNRSN